MRDWKSVVDWARGRRRVLGALLVAAILGVFHGTALIEHVGLSLSRYNFADDARVLIHPLLRVEDPRLFPGDPSVDYFLKSLPDGYHLLYRALGPLVGVVALSKLLPYLLLAVTLASLGFVAMRLSGLAAALGTLSLALGSAYLLGRMAGGLPRSFAFPLLAAGAALLCAGRVKTLAGLVVFAAGFNPIPAFILGATLALLLLLPYQDRGSAAAWSLGRRVALLAATATLAGVVLLPSSLRLREFGEPITPALWSAYPEGGPGGRFDAPDRAPFPALPEAAVPPLVAALIGAGQPLVLGAHLGNHAAAAASVVALLALLGWIPLARQRPEARRLLLLLAAVCTCHALALGAGLRLFIPERYVGYAIPVLAWFGVPSALGACVRARALVLRFAPYVYNLALLALLGAHGASSTGLTVMIAPGEVPLYQAIQALPSSSVVAGWPGESIDNVPYLARRAAYITRETQMAFHTEYTRVQRERTFAFIHAYFASSREALADFRDRRRVTHLLVDRRHFETCPWYFAPFTGEIVRAFQAQKAAGSAVLASIPRAAIYTSGSFVLLDLAKL